jgi:transposase-like protein
MPAPHPPEFRQRAVELAREGAKPVAKIAKDLGISESCLRNWMGQADADEKAARQGHGKVAFMQPEAGLACGAGRGRGGDWRRQCWNGRPAAEG